jgi:hypothetical protein
MVFYEDLQGRGSHADGIILGIWSCQLEGPLLVEGRGGLIREPIVVEAEYLSVADESMKDVEADRIG